MTMPPALEDKDAYATGDRARVQSPLVIYAYRVLGFVLLACGFVGLWLPLLPTTIFLIGAAACFARSSPALQHYLLNHPKFGLPLRDWFEERAISSTGKAAALFGMGIGMAIIVLTVDSLAIIGLASAVLIASGWFVMSRPAPSRERDD
ncbi:MAG: hypothetical protein Rhims3KO_29970 [Hyphomicrobiales bacterium]